MSNYRNVALCAGYHRLNVLVVGKEQTSRNVIVKLLVTGTFGVQVGGEGCY